MVRERERKREKVIEGESEGKDVGVQEDRDDILLDSTIF